MSYECNRSQTLARVGHCGTPNLRGICALKVVITLDEYLLNLCSFMSEPHPLVGEPALEADTAHTDVDTTPGPLPRTHSPVTSSPPHHHPTNPRVAPVSVYQPEHERGTKRPFRPVHFL